jgi:hypothetical protein
MRTTEIAWAAGFFDGEGTVRISSNRNYLAVQQNKPEPLLKLQTIFGGNVHGPYTRTRKAFPNKPQNPYWVWQINGAAAADCAELLLRYSVCKAEKLTELLGHYA